MQFSACPEGYRVMWGYDPRAGWESKASSLEGCKNNCDSRPDCKAFQYSAIEGSGCQLLNIDSPTMPRRPGIDFCLKQGKTSSKVTNSSKFILPSIKPLESEFKNFQKGK